MKPYGVLGIGNALLDYQVKVPFDFLEKHGFKKGSMTLIDADLQHRLIDEIHEKFGAHAIKATSGGCAANTLAGLASYDQPTFFVGKIADDAQGEHYKRDLKTAGIDSDLKADQGQKTGTCLALITPDAERTMLTHLGIAVELKKEDVSAQKIAESEIIYIEGYLWDSASARDSSLEAMKIARTKGVKVAFTFSDSFCVDRYQSDFVHLAKTHIDILFCNEAEALRATGCSNVHEAFQIMAKWSERVFITVGARGALVSCGAQRDEVPTWDVKLVDKLGAGDLFASGALFGVLAQKSPRECGFLGCYSATRVIQQMSARLEEKLTPFVPHALAGPSADEAKRAVLVAS